MVSEKSNFYECLNEEGKEIYGKKLKPSYDTLDQEIPGTVSKSEDGLEKNG